MNWLSHLLKGGIFYTKETNGTGRSFKKRIAGQKTALKGLHSKPFIRSGWWGFVLALVGIIAAFLPAFEPLEELVGLHLLYTLRGDRQAHPDVVIVNIDQYSADAFGLPLRPEKWPRTIHARLVDTLNDAGAAVIVFDVVFKESSDAMFDQRFARAMVGADNVVLCSLLTEDTYTTNRHGQPPPPPFPIEKQIPPTRLLAEASAAFAPFPLPKHPVRLNQYWRFKDGAGDAMTLPIMAFHLYMAQYSGDLLNLINHVGPGDVAKSSPGESQTVFDHKAAGFAERLKRLLKNRPELCDRLLAVLASQTAGLDPRENQLIGTLIKLYRESDSGFINYYGPPGTVPTISIHRVISSGTVPEKETGLQQFKGKAVFVGMAERYRHDQKDGFYTIYSQPNGLDLSGVEVAASIFSNLLEDKPIRPLSLGFQLTLIVIMGFFCGLASRFSTVVCGGILLAGSATYLGLAQIQFNTTATWYPIVVPLFLQVPLGFFGAIGFHYHKARVERRNMRNAFGYYLPNAVVDRLAKNLGAIPTEQRIVYGVCLSSDAADYTALSENKSPDALRELMNRYYAKLFKPVRTHGGNISDIIGDSMLAIWAHTQNQRKIKHAACIAAIEISKTINQYATSDIAAKLHTRLGLHAGEILLGNIGAGDHFEYRPVGDIVNTASRIEGLNKHLGTRILASEEVIAGLDQIPVRSLGSFLLKGKSVPVTIYEIKDYQSPAQTDAIFAQGIAAFQTRQFKGAEKFFSEVLTLAPDDGPALFYLDFCRHYRLNPPDAKWKGTVILTNK